MWTWVLFIVSTVLSYLLRPRPKANKADTFDAPTAEEGLPWAVWWGTQEVAPNTTWFGNVKKKKIKNYWHYYAAFHQVFGWGKVNELIDISFDGKSCRNHHLQNGGSPVLTGAILQTAFPTEGLATIAGNQNATDDDSPAMFGGDSSGGGVEGNFRFYWGTDAQPADPYLGGDFDDARLAYGPTKISRWPGLCHGVMLEFNLGDPFYLASNSARPYPMKVVFRRTAWWETDLSPLGQTAAEATIRYDANPAEILYDVLTHEGYGLGLAPERLDLASFVAAAVTLRTETVAIGKTGFGLSLAVTNGTSANEVMRNITKHIDATLAVDPTTGLYRLKLIRNDYDPDDLLLVDASNSSELQYQPGQWAGTVNEVRVNYKQFVNTTERRGFVDAMVTAQDLANFEATGRIRHDVLDMPYVTDPDIAQLIADKHCRASSIPVAQVTFKMNREGYALAPGDPIKVDAAAYGVGTLIMRVTSIDYGTFLSGELSISAVQDVFGVSRAVYAAPGDSDWVEPPNDTTADGTPDPYPENWGEDFNPDGD